jgi:hypothetical protein
MCKFSQGGKVPALLKEFVGLGDYHNATVFMAIS